MDNTEKNKATFIYSYSAEQQEELRRIRAKYAPPTQESDKMARLRQLDRSVITRGTVAALVVGVISSLVLGLGMCCTMLWAETLFIPGIIIGLIGMAGIGAAYPLYVRIVRKQREKLAPEILRLSEELMK